MLSGGSSDRARRDDGNGRAGFGTALSAASKTRVGVIAFSREQHTFLDLTPCPWAIYPSLVRVASASPVLSAVECPNGVHLLHPILNLRLLLLDFHWTLQLWTNGPLGMRPEDCARGHHIRASTKAQMKG